MVEEFIDKIHFDAPSFRIVRKSKIENTSSAFRFEFLAVFNLEIEAGQYWNFMILDFWKQDIDVVSRFCSIKPISRCIQIALSQTMSAFGMKKYLPLGLYELYFFDHVSNKSRKRRFQISLFMF